MSKQVSKIDWTKPIRLKNDPECKVIHIGEYNLGGRGTMHAFVFEGVGYSAVPLGYDTEASERLFENAPEEYVGYALLASWGSGTLTCLVFPSNTQRSEYLGVYGVAHNFKAHKMFTIREEL